LSHSIVIVILGTFLLRLPASPPGWLLFLRYWYPAFLIPPIFRELEYLVHPIHPVDIDPQLIAIDLAIFGVHPTVWLEQVTFPWLTEYLQLAYISYYFIPFIVAAPLYRQRQLRAFRALLCALMLGYLGSYLLYFLTPARGPRFYLAMQQKIPLEGLAFTSLLQHTLDALEGVQRDAFPSGHTAVALIALGMAARYRPQQVYPLCIAVMSLIVSTVYLRYHYVIDVLAGIIFAGACLGITFCLYRQDRGGPFAQSLTPVMQQDAQEGAHFS
jgi:membrane-associated phospholipid phosphatase